MSPSEIRSRETAQEQELREQNTVWTKTICGIETKVIGAPKILNGKHIEQLEAVSAVCNIIFSTLLILSCFILFNLKLSYFIL